MCVINFSIVNTGSTPTSAQGRYRVAGSMSNWTTFPVDINNPQTPDIVVNGTYELQVRVQYADSTFSDWTESSNFRVGNCSALGNMYAPVAEADLGKEITQEEFSTVMFTEDPKSGKICYVPSLGHVLYLDSEFQNPSVQGYYATYGKFSGCDNEIKLLTVDQKGEVIGIQNYNVNQ